MSTSRKPGPPAKKLQPPLSVPPKRPRRKFTKEFKAEAVRLVEEADGQVGRVARELNIWDSTLGNWVAEARREAAGAPSSTERVEIRELRRELERVTRERDILGKAVAYFSASHPKNV
jgi:transposase